MLTVYSPRHHLHQAKLELVFGEVVPCFEKPERADRVLERVREVGLGDVIAPRTFGLDPVQRVHRPDYVQFLATAWQQWTALGRTHDALPFVWPAAILPLPGKLLRVRMKLFQFFGGASDGTGKSLNR